MNAIFRLGDTLSARLPLLGTDPDLARAALIAEAGRAREMAAVSTVPTPVPVAIGEPGEGYPLPWSVQTWVAGRDALEADPAASSDFARDLATLLNRLRTVDTGGRSFAGTGRGGRLPDHDAWLDECFARSEGLLDVVPLRSMWSAFRELPELDADVLCHGDLTPPNVLVRDGRLAGVLDTGGFAAAWRGRSSNPSDWSGTTRPRTRP